ncbi:MAG: hypothetical protein HND52_18185 [Ignavibacteriae bacterium]|nr:hypothetical protein [Ignavibacteriota bacterium]NOG99892.1 hypothetical protein [Ignavibacteriota bacterium]
MVNSVKLIPSGFNFIDKNWGGVYQGGSYLVIGSKNSAKSLFALNFLKESNQKGKCLYFSNLRSKDLFIQASTINFDLQRKLGEGNTTLVRVLSVPQNITAESIDEYLVEYLYDIRDLIKKFKPKFLIFDEITEFLRYQNVELLRQKFTEMLEALEEYDITSLFIAENNGNNEAKESLQKISRCFTGVINFDDSADRFKNDLTSGIVTIKPNVGHIQGGFTAEYTFDYQKGLTVKSAIDEIMEGKSSPASQRIKIYEPQPETKNKVIDAAINSLELKSERQKEIETEEFSFSNIYEYNDFLLILNTHIALYKATKQKYHLICFNLSKEDGEAQISQEQFRNTIISATDKKDKICIVDNKVLVLIVRSSKEMIKDLTERIHILLTDSKKDFPSSSLDQISMQVIEPDNSFENSTDMIESLLNEETNLNNSFTPLIDCLS